MTLHRFTRSAAVALAIAAVAAPTAAAQNPDQRHPAPAIDTQRDHRSPDTRDAAAGRSISSAPDVVVIKVPQPEAAPVGGIDWTDAGIGAGTVLGLSLIVIGGALVLVRRKQVAPAFRAGAGT